MGSGISNDPTGVFDTPKTGIPAVDDQVTALQAQDAARKQAAAANTEAERPTPNRDRGDGTRIDGV
jgi:hypothetical protein